MARKNYINSDDFVRRLITFIPDIELIPINSKNNFKNGNRLAASGNNSNSKIKKIGYLTDPEKMITARVMEDIEKEVYQLYFIPENEMSVRYSIVSNPQTGKYILIDENEIAEISFSTKINPLEDELVISFPKEIFEYHHNHSDEELLRGKKGLNLKVRVDDDQDCLICELFQVETQEREITKLLIFSVIKSDKFFRLVPVVHNRAIIPIPNDLKGVFIISLYY